MGHARRAFYASAGWPSGPFDPPAASPLPNGIVFLATAQRHDPQCPHSQWDEVASSRLEGYEHFHSNEGRAQRSSRNEGADTI